MQHNLIIIEHISVLKLEMKNICARGFYSDFSKQYINNNIIQGTLHRSMQFKKGGIFHHHLPYGKNTGSPCPFSGLSACSKIKYIFCWIKRRMHLNLCPKWLAPSIEVEISVSMWVWQKFFNLYSRARTTHVLPDPATIYYFNFCREKSIHRSMVWESGLTTKIRQLIEASSIP